MLSEIYQGKITTWNDPAIAKLNPTLNLPADKIIALHRSDSSGDTFIFSSYLSAADPKGWGNSISYGTSIGFPSLSNALGESGNGGMVTGCQATPGCIAYIGISYLGKTQADGLGEAMLRTPRASSCCPRRPPWWQKPSTGGQDPGQRDAVDDLRQRPTATPSSTTSTPSSRRRNSTARWRRQFGPSWPGPSTPRTAAPAAS